MPTPPRPPSSPRRPSPGRAPAPPRLSFSAVRPSESRALDHGEVRPRGANGESFPVPDYEYWPDLMAYMRREWKPGPPSWPNTHMAIVGTSGSGKTTLARTILGLRDFVCIFGTKRSDPSLYAPLEAEGYVVVDRWSPEELRQPKVIFRPPVGIDDASIAQQRAAFRRALLQVFETGGWTLYFDELRYLTENLKLATELNTLWLQGRSEGITIVASTQRPVSVPLNMFEQARHFFLARVSMRDDRKTASEFTGPSAPVVFETAAILPKYEFLYVDKETDHVVRTRVER